MSNGSRIQLFDGFRSFIILLVVVVHVSTTYMNHAPQWWYVVDSQTSILFTLLSLIINLPIMPAMFFIAGYFSLQSIKKNQGRGYLTNKFIRIGLPCILGTFLLSPLAGYFIFLSRNMPMDFFDFIFIKHWTNSYQQSVYWFLSILFLFFVILKFLHGRIALLSSERAPSRFTFFQSMSFIVACSLLMLLVNQYFPINKWFTDLYILTFQPVKLPIYVLYFCLGIFAYFNAWHELDGRLAFYKHFLIWVSLIIFYLASKIYIVKFGFPLEYKLISQLVHYLIYNAFCFSSLILGIYVFREKVNHDSKFWRSMSKTSYGIYFIHIIVFCPIAYMATLIAAPALVKAAIVGLLTFIFSWLITHYFLNRAPLFKKMFSS